MMKCEFETMINKEVSADTFDQYNAMYMSLPEGISKEAFIKMLDVEAIPESPDAIKRKAERAEYVATIKYEVNTIAAEISRTRETINRYKEYLTESTTPDEKKHFQYCIDGYRRYIKQLQAEKKQREFILSI